MKKIDTYHAASQTTRETFEQARQREIQRRILDENIFVSEIREDIFGRMRFDIYEKKKEDMKTQRRIGEEHL